MSSEVQEGVDFFCDGAMFIGRTIYVTQQDWGSGVVSSQCFCTKSQLMNILVAPESKRVEVAMEAREVREVSSTWRLRECGEVFGRT